MISDEKYHQFPADVPKSTADGDGIFNVQSLVPAAAHAVGERRERGGERLHCDGSGSSEVERETSARGLFIRLHYCPSHRCFRGSGIVPD
jgi:hypothetical protein